MVSLYSTLKFEADFPKRRHICTALKVFISEKTILYSSELVYPKRRPSCKALKVVTSEKTVVFINIKESCISNGLQRAESENGNSSSGETILRIV